MNAVLLPLVLLWCTKSMSAASMDFVKGGYIRKADLPDTGEEWISLSEDTQFQPAAAASSTAMTSMGDGEDTSSMNSVGTYGASGLREAQHRLLLNVGGFNGRGARNDRSYASKFADGNTYYDEYSQAWRMLGWYVDCTPDVEADHRRRDRRKRRRLEDENGGDGGGGGDDAYAAEEEEQEYSSSSCLRYILWAAVSFFSASALAYGK